MEGAGTDGGHVDGRDVGICVEKGGNRACKCCVMGGRKTKR